MGSRPIHGSLRVTAGDSGAWLVPVGHLFPSHDHYSIPIPDSVGLGDLDQAGDAWHEIGEVLATNIRALETGDSRFEAYSYPRASVARWYEIANLSRCCGEACETAAAALCEVSGLLASANREHPQTAPIVAAFVTEGALQYLISVGHNLANLGLRLAIESPSCKRRLLSGTKQAVRIASAAVEHPNERKAWIFHSDVKHLNESLNGSTAPAARFLRTVWRLQVSKDWQFGETARNRYFHRWRDGFSSGGLDEAFNYYSASRDAAACLGRALPQLYHQLLASSPRSRRGGFPLIPRIQVMSQELVDSGSSKSATGRAALAYRRFTS